MATDLWEENVAWGGEGGHENDPKSNEKKGREQRANRKSVELRCFFPPSKLKEKNLLSSLQPPISFRNSNHALLLQVELAAGQGRGPRARRCGAQRLYVSGGRV